MAGAKRRADDATLSRTSQIYGDSISKAGHDTSEAEFASGMLMTLSPPSRPTETSYLTSTGMQAEGNDEPGLISPSIGPQSIFSGTGSTTASGRKKRYLPKPEKCDCKIIWNKYKYTGTVISSLLCGVLLVVIGGLLFILVHNLAYITSMQNETSNVTIFQVQSNLLVVLLAEFNSENYSSFVSRIPNDTDFSCSIWVAESLQLNYHPLSSINIILPDNTFDIQFYALTGSIFNVTFSSLTGSNSAYALVNFSDYTGPGINGGVFKSQLVKPTTNIPVIFTVDQSTAGFIELNIINYGLSGSFSYNIVVNQPSLEQSQYICTLNSTSNTCQGTSINDTNYVLAETTSETNSIMADITITLFGRRKKEINLLYSLFGYVTIVLGSALVLVVIVVLLLVYMHSKRHSLQCKYKRLDGINNAKKIYPSTLIKLM